jgi:hypothetical protein
MSNGYYKKGPGSRIYLDAYGRPLESLGAAPYIMLPGARLEIGPHGTPEESLGACCASCADGGPCEGGLGDMSAGTKTTLFVLAAVGVGAVFLFPRVWKGFMDSLWGK